MKLLILIVLQAGLSFAHFPQEGVHKLTAFGRLTNNLKKEADALKTISKYIIKNDDAIVLTRGVKYVISALDALSRKLSAVAASISSGEPLSDINQSLKNWAEAESSLTAAYLGALDDSSKCSVPELLKYVGALEKVSVSLRGLADAINDLPDERAIVIGAAAKHYGYATNKIGGAETKLSEAILAVAKDSDYTFALKKLAHAFKQLSLADSNVSAALIKASEK